MDDGVGPAEDLGDVVQLPFGAGVLSLDDAAERYARELTAWRVRRELSKRELARRMAYERSYVIHIEAGRLPPTKAFTERAEDVLDCDGVLWSRWQDYREAKARERRPRAGRDPRPPEWERVLDDLADQILNRISGEVLDWLGSIRTQVDELTDAAAALRALIEAQTHPGEASR